MQPRSYSVPNLNCLVTTARGQSISILWNEKRSRRKSRKFSPTRLFDADEDYLQVAVGAAVAYHQFVAAWDDAHGVGLDVPSLETAAGQVDTNGLGLARQELQLIMYYQQEQLQLIMLVCTPTM